ncbi:MAG TPA: bifunctional 3,4-dihydroxy-2-butanone-4-phosphate synthase/GTP cyclohydrolase II [Thermoplasmata archaeon]|nr:bifunctional 3,4-dihydroxy-2-butanone-4-phosphate synthase/GTP cyclohydrolase II [Thermoplasmata archaeon]
MDSDHLNGKFARIEEACEELKKGRFVIVVDDRNRENEGDLVMAAEKITPEAINFMESHARGWICVPMRGERLDKLSIPLMVSNNTSKFSTAFTVTVDYTRGTTTGISARDQYLTIKALVSEDSKPQDFAKPGHVRPLRSVEGGVLKRAGHTEAAVDLSRLAGLCPAGVICEIKRDDGGMARLPDLFEFAERFSLKIVTIADLIMYRKLGEKLVKKVAKASLPTEFGYFDVYAYESTVDKDAYIALVKGKIGEEPVLVRVHSSCLTGDAFHSMRCDCGMQLEQSLKRIGEKTGVLLYIQNQEGRGIGLLNKIKAYELQDKGLDTVEANHVLGYECDLRDYGIGAQVLSDLGVKKIKLMTNNPKKMVGLESYGLKIVGTVPIEVEPTALNKNYLKTKKYKMGHVLKEV